MTSPASVSPVLRGDAATPLAASSPQSGAFLTGDAWGLADRAGNRGPSVLRSSPVNHRPAVSGPVLRTVTRWSEYGPTLAEKRLALAALIERRNKGNRSHKLHSRIYSARHEILKLELTSKGQS